MAGVNFRDKLSLGCEILKQPLFWTCLVLFFFPCSSSLNKSDLDRKANSYSLLFCSLFLLLYPFSVWFFSISLEMWFILSCDALISTPSFYFLLTLLHEIPNSLSLSVMTDYSMSYYWSLTSAPNARIPRAAKSEFGMHRTSRSLRWHPPCTGGQWLEEHSLRLSIRPPMVVHI